MHIEIGGNLTALLWAALVVVFLSVFATLGMLRTVADALAKYLTTPRVTFNANLTTSTQDEMDAMLTRMAKGTKGPHDSHV